jgi:hypothetical protein
MMTDAGRAAAASRSIVNKRGTAQWKYKERAIGEAAAAFLTALTGDLLNALTLVPIPPSKAKTDPLYDDRLVQMLARRPAATGTGHSQTAGAAGEHSGSPRSGATAEARRYCRKLTCSMSASGIRRRRPSGSLMT